MTEYFKEATNDEVAAFAGHKSLQVNDISKFLGQAGRLIRNKIALILQSKVLDNFTTHQIVAAAKNFNLIIQLSQWVLNLIEKEEIDKTTLASLDINELKDLTIGEMQNRLVAANKWSFDNFGRKGSDLMNLRKRHLNKIRKAEKPLWHFLN
ncbi:hypothetical protein [Arsenophonus endosymbiont of Crataerina pallida]|uniref:hypothetical protein n=1 Tax=Arsenophonus endosymbiont of Crataerina pallida TaxID=3066235 RepID=UPI0030D18DC0